MRIGKLSVFTQKFFRACKRKYTKDDETNSWELFILYLCELFCKEEEQYSHKLGKDLKDRLEYYKEWPYNPEYYHIYESGFQEYLKSIGKEQNENL